MAMRLDHGAVVMINPDWQSEHPLPIALDPLPPAAGANLTAAEAIAADHDASATPVVSAVPVGVCFSMQAEQSIVLDPKSSGGVDSPHGLILFDGVCVLCSRGCGFVSKRDRRGYFRFVSLRGTSAC